MYTTERNLKNEQSAIVLSIKNANKANTRNKSNLPEGLTGKGIKVKNLK